MNEKIISQKLTIEDREDGAYLLVYHRGPEKMSIPIAFDELKDVYLWAKEIEDVEYGKLRQVAKNTKAHI